MQGLLTDLPLLGVLELVHATRQTGVLDVQTNVPFTVAFQQGEIVAGGILDWMGREALQAAPLLPESGSFQFMPREVTGTPLGPYEHFTTDWARASDEWETLCAVIGSPSRYFRGELGLFDREDGLSIRAASRESEVPLFEVAQLVTDAVREGRMEAVDRFAWYGLRMMPAGQRANLHPVARELDGERNLGDLVEGGLDVHAVREYLLGELRLGLRFPGSGWVLRDLVWEQDHAQEL